MTDFASLWPKDVPVIEGNTVTLQESWMQYGRIMGACRNYSAVHVDGKKSGRVGSKRPELIHMEGAQGELALRRARDTGEIQLGSLVATRLSAWRRAAR